MHPLDALIEHHPIESQPSAQDQGTPGGQLAAVAAAAIASPAVPSQPSTDEVPFPPLRDGFVEFELDDWPEPCPRCNTYEAWWDFLGRQRCQRCDRRLFLRGLRGAHIAIRLRLKSMGMNTRELEVSNP